MMRKPLGLLSLLALLALAGCEVPAQMHWSPDGTKAAYVPSSGNDTEAAIIDEQGKILTRLGKTVGGFAWSADSKVLYYAQVQEQPAAVIELRTNWSNVEGEEDGADAKPPAAGDESKNQTMTINLFANGASTPLFQLAEQQVWYMLLSPDQKWLAIVTNRGEEQRDDNVRLYVYSTQAGQLHLLSVGCGRGICFTGPDRLAFIESSKVKNGVVSEVGTLVEVDLDDAAMELPRKQLIAVLAGATPWMAAVGEDILFTSIPVSLPMLMPSEDGPPMPAHALFRYGRSGGKVTNIQANVGDMFMPSPDGRLVLFQQVAPPPNAKKEPAKLAVLELESSAVHVLRDMPPRLAKTQEEELAPPMYPAWRGNRQIAYIAPDDPAKPPVAKGERIHFDVTLYDLTDQFQLRPARELSSTWPLEMKPSIKKPDNPPGEAATP